MELEKLRKADLIAIIDRLAAALTGYANIMVVYSWGYETEQNAGGCAREALASIGITIAEEEANPEIVIPPLESEG